MMTLLDSLAGLNHIKFSAYRTAAKLRALQKRLHSMYCYLINRNCIVFSKILIVFEPNRIPIGFESNKIPFGFEPNRIPFDLMIAISSQS